MKVSSDGTNTGSPSAAPASTTQSRVPPSDAKGRDSKPFSKVLKQKKQAIEEEMPLAAGTSVPPILPSDSGPPIISQGTAPVQSPEAPALHSLVQEIAVAVAPGGTNTVDVQFHAKTLAGLQVRISGNANTAASARGMELNIRFTTSSPSVSQLLSSHLGQLAQGLEARGLHAGPIQVEMVPIASGQGQPGSTSTDSRRGQGEGRHPRDGNEQQKQEKK